VDLKKVVINLKKVLRNLPEEERKYVQASMLNRLGYQKPGSADVNADFFY
jgi:hypothetical protein